jgi:hypothetical protein
MADYPRPPKGFEDKLIYLAGPMTGLPDFGYPEFRVATRRLQGHGLNVYSPHLRWDHEDEETRAARKAECYMLHGFKLLLKCNSIALMPGWRQSGGSQKELILALHAGYSIYYYQPENDFPLLELK